MKRKDELKDTRRIFSPLLRIFEHQGENFGESGLIRCRFVKAKHHPPIAPMNRRGLPLFSETRLILQVRFRHRLKR